MTKLQPAYGGRPIVRPSGNLHAPVYIVGKAPSYQESRTMQNFSSTSGQTIFRSLEKAGVDTHQCRCSTVSWIQPPDENNIYSCEKLGVGVSLFKEHLLEDIRKVNPKVILAIGEDALNFLTSKSSINKWRGSPLPSCHENIKAIIIPTIEPDKILKGLFPMLIAFRSDCVKVGRVLRGDYKPREREFLNFSRGTTLQTFKQELRRLRDLKGFLAYDIEGWYPTMSCISFSDHPDFAISVPLNNVFPEKDTFELFKLVREVLENEKSFKIAQNMLFDNSVLAMHGIGVRNIFMDTMVAHKCVFTETGRTLPHSLDFLTSIYTWEPYYKDDRALVDFIGNQQEADDYSCKDSAVTLEIVTPLLRELESHQLTEFFFNEEMGNIKAYGRIASKGLFVDETIRKTMLQQATTEFEILNEKLKLLTEVKNPQSSAQVKKYLYEELNLPKKFRKRKTKEGLKRTETVDEKALAFFIQKYPQHREILSGLINSRKRQHDISNYLECEPQENRHYFSINTAGTTSGRLSVSKLLNGRGIAAHGIPEKMRGMFTAPFPDCVLFSCDSKQAESMFVTWVAEEEVLFKAFMNKEDTHKLMGARIFGIPAEEITGDLRSVAKKIRHATNYWMGPRLLQEEVNYEYPDFKFNFSDAKNAIATLRRENPKTYKWGQAIERSIYSGNRTLINCWGRKRILFGPASSTMIKSAISFNPQSAVSDLIHKSARGVEKELSKQFNPEKNYICLPKHDELFGICEEVNVSKVKYIITKEMEQKFPGIVFNSIPLSIPAEFSIGKKWNEMEEV